MLVFLIGLAFAYGFGGTYRSFPTGIGFTGSLDAVTRIGFNFLNVIGFSLIGSSMRKGTALGLASGIITVAVCYILSPLLQVFWYNVINQTFDQPNTTSGTIYTQSNQGFLSVTSYHSIISSIIAVSFSACSTLFVGKVNIWQ